jgi:CheY-like chemotaxis protein
VKPNKVLVVDDSRLLHKMYGVMLEGTPLVHAYNGFEALQKLAENPDVDLVILDINMPQMNGLELLGQLRGGSMLSRMSVIIVSTEGKEEDAKRGLFAGAKAYLRKPFRNEDLVQTIASLDDKKDA